MTKIQKLIAEASPGDRFAMPFNKPRVGITILHFIVLRREEDMVFISEPQFEHPTNRPYVLNPVCWDKSKAALVDATGEVPSWYNINVRSFPKGGMELLAGYERVPREEHLRFAIRNNGEDLESLAKEGALGKIHGIFNNNEVATLGGKFSLALDALGIEHNAKQLFGVMWAFTQANMTVDFNDILAQAGVKKAA